MLRDSHDAASARYEMLGPLGSGGFGAVYEARDPRTGQRVAIKELEHTSGEGISRFKHEFRALADCHHVNLVGLRELIEQRGRWLIVMELVPGTDLLGYVCSGGGDEPHRFDEARLRGALLGIVKGLRALHGYGILHRDLKPTNVRVTPEGRAVLLDFGLVTSIAPEHQSTDALGLGTIAYMAPEQAQGKQLGPEADVYALGACLFEALTGRLPIDGDSPMDILMRKQIEEAPRPSSLAPDLPADLDQLCAQMLALDPARRPDLRTVQAVLTGVDPGPSEPVAPAPRAVEALFSGREAELQILARALAQTEDGALRVVLVEGESGVGKSELAAEFVRRAQRDPRLLTLRGRCYENEQVSYKAFDGCIDELARQLARLSDKECDALLPLRSALLAQLFPVLRNVRAIARAPREGTSADPTARRLEAFAALAALLARLAEERPLILLVDDLQWADVESFRLLQALFEAPEVPPLLLIATVRPRGELDPDVLAHVQALRQRPNTSVVELLGLPAAQARALAQKLLGREVPEQWLATLTSESEGHPLFLGELVQYAEAHPAAAHGPIRLEDALRARIERSEPAARALLELVALAARPHGSHVFAHALGQDVADAARSLLSARFLRLRKDQQLGCFHDRIRHAVVELIPRARLASLHKRLAEALAASPDSDASELARHWDLAGDRERASDAYERAADLALTALAFTRAAQLYGRALELRDGLPDARLQRLTIQRAHALAGAGASGEAAALYQQAADRADGDARIVLRNKAAQHLVLSSQVVVGIAAARTLLRELGFVLPNSTLLAVLRSLWDALWLWLLPPRRRRDRPMALGPAEPHMAVVHDLTYVIGSLDMRTYLPLNLQAVRRAQRGGTRIDAARAAAWRAWMRALQGSIAQAVPLLDYARELLGADASPAQQAGQWFVEGSAFMAGYDYAESSRRLEQAHRLLEEECPDQSWLLLTVRYHLSSTWYHTGQHRKLAAQVARWIATARERNDVLSVAMISGMGYGFARHLVAGQPQRAVRELDEALGQLPAESYAFPHLGRYAGMAFTLLYEGGDRALAFLDAHEREHGRSVLMRTGSVRQGRRMLRALAILGAIVVSTGPERERRIADARKVVRALGRRSPFEQGFAEAVLAQIEAVAGHRTRALAHARTARALYERAQHGNQRGARYLEGLLEGGERGRTACEATLAELRAEGWLDPLRALTMSVPVHPMIAREEMPLPLAPSTLLRGRYEVLGTLDPRGVGSVFRARDMHTGRTIALKELTHRGSASLERFKQEFRALQEVQAVNLVQLESMFSHEGIWYMAMELVEGQDFLRYVRPAGALEPVRLRLALEGLVEGLIALHEAGFVHRDLRPEKVRVTGEGRVVLLDFGSIARIGDAREVAPVGSREHAAPEQLVGCVPHPSADVYALGDCMYRALTGRAPFEAGHVAELLARKQGAPPAPAECPALPALAAHCQVMLSPVTSARPGLHALRSALRADDARATLELTLLRAPEPEQKVVFTGRAAELRTLEELFERTADDGLTLVLIEGASGMGKSALATAFAERTLARHPSGRVLRSRCYESEQLAHRAFDGAVDQLARLLAALPVPQCEALMPKRAALLAQLFPVLASVPAIGQASKKGLPADPTLRQLGARTCFAQLLSQLSRELELLLVVDDLQWADDDSFRMFDVLLAEARALPLLIVATVRASAAAHDEPRGRALAALRAHAQVRVVSLEGLRDDDAAALVDALADPPLAAERRAQVVHESKGHPGFLRELLEQERRGDAHALTLDAALRARIAHFEPDARELLALTALAARPYPRHVLARALGARELAPRAVIALLGSGYLQRAADDALVCERERIRALAEGLLSPEARRGFAEALARALETEPRSEPAERARLWEQAGQPERAIQGYEQAGDRALAGLGFGLAAEHYAHALGLIDGQRDERWRRIEIQRGHALARSGDSESAAAAYERAASGAPSELAVSLRVWAAQHLMQSAQVDRGLAAAKALLAELGEPLPASERAAVARIGWEDLRLGLRGFSLRARPRVPTPSERLRFEAMRALLPLLSALAPLSGLALTLRYLRTTLDAGEPELSARALSLGAMWRTIRTPNRDDAARFQQARTLADEVGDPLLTALVELDWGVACMQNRVAAAPGHFARAHELLQSRCPGEPWALDNARSFLGAAWGYTGDWNAIARSLGTWTEEARARRDKYGLASLAGFGSGVVRHLLVGRTDLAREELAEAMGPWAGAAFSHLHFGAFVVAAATRTVSGDAGMLAWLDRDETALRAPHLMRMPTCRLQHEQAQLNALFLTLDAPTAPALREVLARTRGVIRALGKNPAEPAPGVMLLARAVVDALEGQSVRALSNAQAAHQTLHAQRNYLASGAHYLEGFLEGGEAGRLKRELALHELYAQGWQEPRCGLALTLPGAHLFS